MKPRVMFSLLAVLVAALSLPAHAQMQQDDLPTVAALVETAPSRNDGANDPAIWLHPTDPALSTIIGADDEGALVVYGLDGVEIQAVEEDNYVAVDVRYPDLNGLVAAGADDDPLVYFFTVNPDTRALTPAGQLETGLDIAALCLYQSSVDDAQYVFVGDEDGNFEQWQLALGDTVGGELVREFSIGGEIESCTVDDGLAAIYIAEGELALWRYGAEPERGLDREMVDAVGMNIAGEIEGVAIYYAAEGAGYLLVSNQTNDSFNVYTRDENEFVGSFRIGAGDGIDTVTEAGGVEVINLPLNDLFPAGVFVVTDDSNTDPNAATNFKLASWGDIAAALSLTTDTTFDRRSLRAGMGAIPQIPAVVETAPVPGGADAADDPAIWIHPTDPALSTIIGTDKQGGLAVYNLDGSELQYLPVGRLNNVDLRYNFPLGGELVALVVASNRTDDTLSIFAVNPETRLLEEVSARAISGELPEVYGLCLYVSPVSGRYYVFVNSSNTGDVNQFEVFDDGAGRVDARLVRQFIIGTQTEGCVADDPNAVVYIGEEGYGIWRYQAEPDADTEGALVDSVDSGQLTADVEGMAIYATSDGGGYLIVSSQGSSDFAVYDRVSNAYIGRFAVRAGDTADAVSGTDGLDVTNFPLNDTFSQGVFVAQDDRNLDPEANQSFKLVRWEDIAAALGLTVDTTFDPRTVGAAE